MSAIIAATSKSVVCQSLVCGALESGMQTLTLANDILPSLSTKSLFYPCAGDDWRSVVPLFVPYITRFWFVDICYGALRDRNKPVEVTEPLVRVGNASVKDVECVNVAADSHYRGMSPFIRTEQFRHQPSDTPIEINWYMWRGPSALRNITEPVGIFLYRGDSSEGGSGTEWLVATKRRGQFRDVLNQLVDGGLIITDGSNPGLSTNNPYSAFAQFISMHITAQNAAADAKAFCDLIGNQFTCIGYIDCPPERYKGPVLIWQLRRGKKLAV